MSALSKAGWAALFLAVAMLPSKGYSYAIRNLGGTVVRWEVPEVTYELDVDGWSGISDGSDRQQVKESFADWDAVACSNLGLFYAGDTSVNSVLPTGEESNGRNEIIWKEDYWPFSHYVLGVTSPLYNWEGVILEADIALNGQLNWSSTGMAAGMDIKSVAIHEIGHLFGLQHPLQFDDSDPPTMAPFVNSDGKTATLAQDDINGICFLYPASGVWTCSSDAECPWVVAYDASEEEYTAAYYTCASGTCVFDNPVFLPGQKDIGGDCDAMEDCQVPLFCLPGSTVQLCTRWCSSSFPCPSGFDCLDVWFAENGICAPPGLSGTAEIGDACFTQVDCVSGAFCQDWWSGGFCSVSCFDPANGTGCPSGFVCMAVDDSPIGSAVCMPGNSGDKEDGEPCTRSVECISQLCFETPILGSTVCRSPCDPSQATPCPEDTQCVSVGDGLPFASAACIPNGSLPHKSNGVDCQEDWECQSGYCFYDWEVDSTTCRSPCVPEVPSTCPDGTACISDGNGAGACLFAPVPLYEDGTKCSHNHECRLDNCAPLPGVTFRSCQQACSAETVCEVGWECVYFESPLEGLCMASLKGPGEACSSTLECTTVICMVWEGIGRCLAPCVQGSCPADSTCFEDGSFGPVCVPDPPAPAEPVVEEPSLPDLVSEPSPEVNEEGIAEQVDAEVSEADTASPRGGDGCRTGSSGRLLGLWQLVGLLGIVFLLKKRRLVE